MAALRVPRKDIFLALSFGELHKLSGLSPSDLRPFLPLLSSYLQLQPSGDSDVEQDTASLQVARALLDLPAASQVLAYTSADFQLLEEDARKEQRVLQKSVSDGARASNGSVLAQSVEHGLCLEFERGDVERRFRLLLSEVLYLMMQQSEGKHVESSELLDCSALKWELSDMLSVALGQMPGLLPVVPVVEAMLHCCEATHMVVQLVANHPSYYQQVVSALVTKGDNQDEVTAMGRLRTAVLRHLCALHPVGTLSVQRLALETRKQPSLVLYLALDQVGESDTVAGEGNPLSDPVVMTLHNIFVTGDDSVKEWFRQYIKLNQHKYRRVYTTALSVVRQHLMERLRAFDSTQISAVGIAAPKAEPMETSEELVGEGVVRENVTDEDMDDDTSCERPHDKAHDDDHTSMEEEFYPLPPSSPSLTDSQCSEVSVILRVLCALKLTGLFVLRQEGSLVLRLMTHLVPPHTDRGVHLIKTMFAVLVACPFLVSNEKREEAVVRWFHWLIDNQNSYSRCGSEGAYGEMLLLAAIHFQEKRRSQIMEMVSGTLGFSLQHAVRPGKHSDIRELFLSVFTEDVVCTQALRVQPTVGLNGKMTGFYPIHCVYNLLKSQTFLKHSIAVTPWVVAQLMTAAEPLHLTLPQLIQELVPAILAPPTRSTYGNSNSGITFRQTPISEQELLRVFRVTSDPAPSCATQLLFLYYVLLYHNTWLGNLKAYSAHLKAPPPTYSPHVLGSVPVKWLLQLARRRQSDYSVLYPSLVKLVITHLPHVAMTTSGLEESRATPILRSSDKSKCTPEGVERVLQKIGTAPARVAMVIQSLSLLEPSELIPLEPCLVPHLCDLLDGETPRGLQEAMAQLWQRLNTIMSKKLWVDTVNAFSCSDSSTTSGGGGAYTSEDLVEDPLLVLKCDPRVFRCAPLCEIVLCVLSAFLAASRAWVNEQAHVQSFTNKAFSEHMVVGERDAACTSYCALQESAAVQILLDVCLTQQEDKLAQPFGPLLSVQREVVCLICSHLHQVFIGNPTVAKLVHFQGYPSSLIGMMVEGVPSMHICLDFISELLEQTQISQQQFGIQLASQVLSHYPLPSATDTAQLLLKKLHTLLAEVPRQAHTDLFIPVLPFLVTLCQSFPPLSEETTRFLLKLGRQHLLGPSRGERTAEKQGVKEFLSSIEGDGEERGRAQEQQVVLLAVQQTFKQLAEKAIIKF